MFKKILSYSPHIFALLFIMAFAAFAWTEPTVAPPGGNVSAPLNIGSTGQSKAGGLILNTGGAVNGLIVDQGKVGIGTQSPSETLDVVGNIKIAGFKLLSGAGAGKVLTSDASGAGSWQAPSVASDPADKTGYTEGLVAVSYSFLPNIACGCAPTSCSAVPPGYCADTYNLNNCGAYTTYVASCLSGWALKTIDMNTSNQAGTCATLSVAYECYKPPIASLCGNGVVDTGEACDDGNDVDTAGNCARDCSVTNQFSSPYHYCNSGAFYYTVRADQTSEDQWCKEQGQGFVGMANDSPTTPGYIYYAYWSGSSWVCGGGYPWQTSYPIVLRCKK